MARIPQYNRSVTPQNTPKPYIQSYASPEAFGVNVSRAAENFTNARMNLLDNIATLKASYDKAKLLEFSNNIDRWAQENLYDTEKGYFYKTGKEAMGKSPEIMESYDKFADDYISKAGFVAGWEGQARQIAQSKKLTIERGVQAHDKKQSDAWMEAVYMDGLSSVFSRAVQSRNNPNDLDMFYKDGMTIIDNYAAVKGWDKDPETLGMKKKEFEAGYHKQILDAYLAEGSLKASEYFEKYKDKMPSNMQTAYLAKITNQKINYIARTNAEKLTGLSPDEAYKFIDNIENIDERDATEREYNRKIREEENIKNKIEKDTLDNFYTKVLEKTQKGENLSYDDIPDNLDSQTKLGLMKYVAANGKPENDDETWEMLYQKSVSDAQGFANLDLNKYRGYLSESEYKSFLKRQNDIKTGDFYTQIKDDDKKISDALDAMGLKNHWRNKDKDIGYSEIRALVKELEARKGRKITDNELSNIINSLGYKDKNKLYIYKQIEKGMRERTGFIRDVVNDFTYYQNKHNGQMPSDEEKMKIINKRINAVIIRQNDNLSTSLTKPYTPKTGDVWMGHIITSSYGKRTSPTRGATSDHKGVDLAFKNNETFPAFASGTVVTVGKHNALGNYVDIKSNDGTIHRYAHANSILVKKGDVISQGQAIGKAGSTGISTGPHLHYAKIKNGNFINPLSNINEELAQNPNKGWAF